MGVVNHLVDWLMYYFCLAFVVVIRIIINIELITLYLVLIIFFGVLVVVAIR